MPKVVELTVELNIQRVSCPGVWLCQDGRVSLTIYAFGTSYQTCLLPPVFPLMFKDVFYFKKRFQETCALHNICCLLKDETIYCELLQWSSDCRSSDCVILAQYLGALNEVLFPPNLCSSDGVDLLMRRSQEFPGILSPKIEIATKVRIDEVWTQQCNASKATKCQCVQVPEADGYRQKPVCHTPIYHRHKCNQIRRPASTSRSRSRSGGSRSLCSFAPEPNIVYSCPNAVTKSYVCPASPRRQLRCQEVNVYNVETASPWRRNDGVQNNGSNKEFDECVARKTKEPKEVNTVPSDEERIQKLLIESRYIDEERFKYKPKGKCKNYLVSIQPCVCDICTRYYEQFHPETAHR